MKRIVLLCLLMSIFAACKKHHDVIVPPTPTIPVDDARTVLLKEIVAQGLPNPYYKFVYDAQRYVTEVNFASGFSIYNVVYENKRVKKLTNINNGHNLLYTYTGDNVTKIDEQDASGKTILGYELSYNTAGKLIQLNWKNFNADPAGDLYKKLTMTYHVDGNLATIETYSNSSGALTWVKTQQFSNYDSKNNMDDFSMLYGFFDSFLFLPQVRLQLNNAAKEIITGAVNDFKITYTYQYNNNLPIAKNGTMLQTRGSNAGQTFQFGSQFSYY